MRIRLVLFAMIAACAVAFGQAQPPNITSIYPPGGKRGASLEVTLTGTSLAGAGKVIFADSRVQAEVIPGTHNTDGACKLKLTIAPETPCGQFEFRLATNRGLTAVERISVGDTAELEEKEANNSRKDAQRLVGPITVFGRLNGAEDADWFVFSAKKDETFIFDCVADRAGSGLDGDLFLHDSFGRLMATNGDFNKLDPFLAHKFTQDGDYYVALRDFNYRGGANFTYRLTVGVFPYIYAVAPASGAAGMKTKVQFVGVNLGGSAEGEVDLTGQAAPGTVLIGARTAAGESNALPFAVESLTETVKPAPTNHTMETAAPMASPGAMTARLETAGKADYYSFEAKKGDKLAIEIVSARLGSPMDPVLDLLNSMGATIIGETDDTAGLGRDSRLNFDAPADGNYLVRVRDRHERGGDRYFYRLRIARQEPSFELTTNPASPALGPGNTIPLTVIVTRQNGFNGAIELELVGLPAGVKANLVPIPAGQNQTVVTLTAAADAKPEAGKFTVRGKSGELVRTSAGAESIIVNNQPQARPAGLTSLAVTPPQDFTLTVDNAAPTVVRGKPINVTVTVKRKEGFKGAIALAVIGLSGGITATTPNIAEAAVSGAITLTVPAGLAPGVYRLIPTGTFAGPHRLAFSTEPIMLTVTEK